MTNRSDPLPLRTYVAAGGVVVDPVREQVLALLRPARPGPDARPEIRLPKGHVEPGETYSQAALREVKEEAGLSGLQILADLGQQTVEFNWQGHHYIRQEFYFLMVTTPQDEPAHPEAQFRPEWLDWERAETELTFDAEREWVRRACVAWTGLMQAGSES